MVEVLGSGDFGDALMRLVEKDTIIPVLGVVFGCSIAIVGIIAGAMRKSSQTKARERTRSEIAAYIAEGSMTPEEGERLLNAGPQERKGCCS